MSTKVLMGSMIIGCSLMFGAAFGAKFLSSKTSTATAVCRTYTGESLQLKDMEVVKHDTTGIVARKGKEYINLAADCMVRYD